MISAKYASIIAVAAIVAGSFIALPDLRAYAANTVFSTDIVDGEIKTADLAGNAVTASKIKDGEVKAAEIAPDSVGGSELIGVTKLLFGQCVLTSSEGSAILDPGEVRAIDCTISGVDSDDSAVATMNAGSLCFAVERANTGSGEVTVYLRNNCSNNNSIGPGKIGIVVFDK